MADDPTKDMTDEQVRHAIAFALSMEDGDGLPCLFELQGAECEDAAWIAWTKEQGADCPMPAAMPMCDRHKREAQTVYRLRNWPGFDAPPCEFCGHPSLFVKFTPIYAAS